MNGTTDNDTSASDALIPSRIPNITIRVSAENEKGRRLEAALLETAGICFQAVHGLADGVRRGGAD